MRKARDAVLNREGQLRDAASGDESVLSGKAAFSVPARQHDMLVEQMLPLYDMLLREKILKLDLVAYPERACFEKAYQTFPESAGHYSDHIRLGGLKIFLDGSPQGRTAWVRTPYLGGAPDDRGYGTMKDEEVREAFVLAARKGVQPLAHCNGDAAAAQMIRCLAEEEKKYPALKDLKPVMIHAQLLGIDQIPEAVQLGIIASFFVAHAEAVHQITGGIRETGVGRVNAEHEQGAEPGGFALDDIK